MNKKNFEYLILLLILILSFYLRLYKIDNPIADWHSFRQADTSAVSRNFTKLGYDIFVPRFDDLSSIPSGKANPNGYRMVEFPFYNIIQAKTYQTFPQKSLEWWGRMVSILFSIGSIIFVYLIVKYFGSSAEALLSALFMGILPYNIYYSRVILPEPMMIFCSLGMIYFYIRWGEYASKISYLLALFFASIAFLVKPTAVFFLLPIIYYSWHKWGLSSFKKIPIYVFLILSVIPFLGWRLWMTRFPEGIPDFNYLLNEANIRFKGAFFRWIFGERIGKLILGGWGIALLVIGIASRIGKKSGWFFHYWLVSVLLYFVVFASGNVRHDYYQVLAIPIIAIFLAKGICSLIDKSLGLPLLMVRIITIIAIGVFMISFSWYDIKGYYNVNHWEFVEAGKKANEILPKEAKVIAPQGGDTAFLYQINRQGWAVITDSIENMINQLGATSFVSVNFNEDTKNVAAKYKILWEEKNFIIIDLTTRK